MAIEPVSDASGFVTPPPALTHDPCCSSHGASLGCKTYRRTHFVEVGPCCSTWAKEHPEYGTASEPKHPEANAPAAPPDIESALRQLAAYRERNDNQTQAQVLLADRLTSYLVKVVPVEERETAGKAMVRAATALASLLQFDINPAALCNVQMLAGERMVAESRGRNVTAIAPEFQVGDEVLWRWHEDGGSGRWFKARLVERHPAGYPKGWAGDVTERGTFYASGDTGWDAPTGHNVFLDEPSMTLIHRPSKEDTRG